MRLRSKPGHDEGHLDLTGNSGNAFRIILRRSNRNVLDFSAILGVQVPQSSRLFRLLRYNGRSHEHTNTIEGDTFYDFHIHKATERYQIIGAREDSYAEETDRYSDYKGALDCLLADNNFQIPSNDQLTLI